MSNVAGSVTVVLSADQTSFSASLTEAQRQLDKFGNKAKAAGHGTVSGMQAASASIRLLENPLGNNMRAIERLISQSKVLSSVMKAAFPLVGAIAIGAMIAKLGKEVYEFIEKVNGMPAAITKGFGALNLSAQTSTDTLEQTNHQLENAIAKLQGKPVNNLKLEFDAAKIAADHLAESIQADNEKLDQLLSKNHLSGWALLLNKQGTADREGTVSYYGAQQDDAALRYQQAVRNHDDAGAAKAQADLKASQNSELQNVLADRASRKSHTSGPGNEANIAIDTGVASTILDEQNKLEQTQLNTQLTAQKAKLDAAHAAAEAAKAAARAALEARKRAAEEQLREWESENSDWKAEEDRSLRQDAAWWKSKLDTLTTGSLNYRAVNQKVNKDIITANREQAAMMVEFTKNYLSEGDKTSWVSASDIAAISAHGKAAAEWLTALQSGIDLQRQNADAIAESALQMAVATGNMTKLDAAQALANIHTQQYTAQMDALKDARQGVMDNGSLTDLERMAQLAQSDNAIAALNGNRNLQRSQDNAATNPQGSSASVGFVGALDEFVQASKDAAGQMRELTTGTLASLNAEILKGMTGGKTDFKSVGSNLAKNVAGVGLQKAEGSVLGALGFGSPKADGTKGSPLYVRMADALSGAAASATGLLSGKGGGIFSSLMGSLFHAIPGFAGGGAISPGTLAMVGERGPELAYFGNGASITPNHQLNTFGGSQVGTDSNVTINVANGVTPEQMNMHVHSALQEYHEKVVVPGIMPAMKNQQSRRPSTSR